MPSLQAEQAARAFNAAWHPRLRLLAHDCRSHSQALVRHLVAHDAFELHPLLLAVLPTGSARAHAAASSSGQSAANACWDGRQIGSASLASRGAGRRTAWTSMRPSSGLRAALQLDKHQRGDLLRAARTHAVACRRMHFLCLQAEAQSHVRVCDCPQLLPM